MSKLALVATTCALLTGCGGPTKEPQVARGPQLQFVEAVEYQPLAAQVKRLIEALDYIGQPLLNDKDKAKLLAACESDDHEAAREQIQQLLDPHCLIGVNINPESRVKSDIGPARPMLVEQGWATFLIKVHNEGGVSAELVVESPNTQPVYERKGGAEVETKITDADIANRWMDLNMVDSRPLTKNLSGLQLEYRIIQIYSRDQGQREGQFSFNVGQGTQDVGFRSDVNILFHAKPSTEVKFIVRDVDGSPTTANFTIKDEKGRVYPSQAKRLAPDFFFHAQIYRADGETVTLPPGTYTINYTRGPEYHIDTKTIEVPEGKKKMSATFQLRRWIKLADQNWYSGDHHVHAAGCAHYADPTQGVTPEAMFRHIVGEDLNVGCVLSWGPCWYYQKQFFEGGVHKLSTKENIMRYDVEVSQFPSDFTGHLCLLKLTEDDYPGTSRIEHWPSWDLPILQWGKEQGAVVGFSHSGWGLHTKDHSVPNFEIPPFDGIGANEYIMDITHDAVDFISAVDTPWPFELNIWYHTNNAGYRVKLSGETDFPCIYGERVGLGRIYAKVDGELNFDDWVEELKNGRSYVCDGLSHLVNFNINGREVGTEGSELALSEPQTVKVRVAASALLGEEPNNDIRNAPLNHKPFWHIERARIEGTRRVPVEVIVNGYPVERTEIEADGSTNNLEFDVQIDKSSWVAVRIFASSHTNPIYLTVGDKPVLPSKKSVQWCIDSLEQCWSSKSKVHQERFKIDPEKNPEYAEKRKKEFEAMAAAYDHARKVYAELLTKAEED